MSEASIPRSLVPYHWLRAVVGFLLGLVARIRIEGAENVPPNEPFLLCVNHLSILDPPLMMIAVPQTMSVVVASKYAGSHNPIGWIVRLVDVIFVRRGEVDRQALRAILSRLKAGRSVGLAPEGTRSRSGRLQPGKEGAAYIAQKAGVRVLPAAIWGSEKVVPSLKRLRRAEVHIRIGTPLTLDLDPALPRSAQLEQATRQIMLAIARMLPVEYRGAYEHDLATQERATPIRDQRATA